MPVPKRKTSKMQLRQRKAANRYKGIQTSVCSSCGSAVIPHRVCDACGNYKGKLVVPVSE